MRKLLLVVLTVAVGCRAAVAFADELSGGAAAAGVTNPIEISGSSANVRATFTETISSLTSVFQHTGAAQTWVVPRHVYAAEFTVVGASGASNSCCNSVGGQGGKTVTTIPLTPGETLNIYVGGPGGNGSAAGFGRGGFNGGGNSYNQGGNRGGGGGGASDIRRGGNTMQHRWIVAGGGGGAGMEGADGGDGGNGGGLISQRGEGSAGGFAATQSSGGAAGNYDGAVGASSGTFGQGGQGTQGNGFSNSPGGGGGGGWFGGGGSGLSGNNGLGGAGGSSYSRGYSTTHTQGNGLAPAYIAITYPASPVTTWQIGVSSHGQFQISNSSEGLQSKTRVTINDQGFVGVNTSTPEALLHVDQGNLLLTNGKIYIREGAETASPPFDPSFAPLSALDVVGGTIMVRGGGKVIIGTTTPPTSALDIFNGSITVRGIDAGVSAPTFTFTTTTDGIIRSQMNPGLEIMTSTVPDGAISTMTVTFSTRSWLYVVFTGSPTDNIGGDIFVRFNNNASALYSITRASGTAGSNIVSRSSLSATGLSLFGEAASTWTLRYFTLTVGRSLPSSVKLGDAYVTSASTPTESTTWSDAHWQWYGTGNIDRVDVFMVPTNSAHSGGAKWKVGSGLYIFAKPSEPNRND